MILLLSFSVCAKVLYCYIAVHYLLQEVFELENHYFFAWAGWSSSLKGDDGIKVGWVGNKFGMGEGGDESDSMTTNITEHYLHEIS